VVRLIDRLCAERYIQSACRVAVGVRVDAARRLTGAGLLWVPQLSLQQQPCPPHRLPVHRRCNGRAPSLVSPDGWWHGRTRNGGGTTGARRQRAEESAGNGINRLPQRKRRETSADRNEHRRPIRSASDRLHLAAETEHAAGKTVAAEAGAVAAVRADGAVGVAAPQEAVAAGAAPAAVAVAVLDGTGATVVAAAAAGDVATLVDAGPAAVAAAAEAEVAVAVMMASAAEALVHDAVHLAPRVVLS
jgi:hypothetical protein